MTFRQGSETALEQPWGNLGDDAVGDLVGSSQPAPTSAAQATASHDAFFTEENWLLDDVILKAGQQLAETL